MFLETSRFRLIFKFTISVLVTAMHPTLFALAVVAGAIRALNDASGSVSSFMLSVTGLGALGLIEDHQQHEEDGCGGVKEESAVVASHVYHVD